MALTLYICLFFLFKCMLFDGMLCGSPDTLPHGAHDILEPIKTSSPDKTCNNQKKKPQATLKTRLKTRKKEFLYNGSFRCCFRAFRVFGMERFMVASF